MSPLAIARNVDRVRKMRWDSTDYYFANPLVYRRMQEEADRLARQTATAVRQSALAEHVKESLLHTLEPS